MAIEFRIVDPRMLRLPPSRSSGADPAKLQRQIARFGDNFTGMPRIVVYATPAGDLIIFDGVTRATRLARLAPGCLVEVEVIGILKISAVQLPRVEDRI